MFLKQVYRYNKWLFAAFVAFGVAQLLVFSKPGIVFSPFYNYGMYSGVIHIKPVYSVTHFEGLKAHEYSPQEWDKIFVTLERYEALPQNDSIYINHIARLYRKIGLSAPNIQHFSLAVPPHVFEAWYSTYVKKTVSNGALKSSLARQTKQYRWTGQKLEPLP
ncbi:MAG: hypothetical protein EAY75_12395 [Bacteroidetes bacterium]|nr:MAG: hypothetical protein EAY75_12395 [Bacteroidota bacterium]